MQTKFPITTLLALLFAIPGFAQEVSTSGDNSPAVIAQNFSVTYGVRADAVEAILWIYEAEGYDVNRRKRATEQILREYAQSPEKQQNAGELSEATRRKMGLTDAPKVANALEWDLFARNHYLSTTGYNSPAVLAKGDVNIWYGIPPKALRALAAQLEKNKTDLTNFDTKLADQVKKYEELRTELETYGSQEKIYVQAEALLEEGKLEEAERLIESDFNGSMKRQAYKGYIYGKTKALLLKYEEAAKGFKNAVNNDEGNSTYHLYYADNENILTHFDEATTHYEIALGIDTLTSGNEARIAILLNNLGEAWRAKGEYDKAIEYFEKALQINLKAFGDMHTSVAPQYNNLGSAWTSKGEYDKAIKYFEKALQIYLKVFGENHPNVAGEYINLGVTWGSKGEYDKAIGYYEKALQIYLKAFGETHPDVAIDYNNLGLAWKSKGEYDRAIEYFEKALQIDLKAFGENHPNIATRSNNLGLAWSAKGEYDKAIEYFEKVLQIYLKAFGETHPNFATVYNNLGAAWAPKGEYDKAIEYYEKALPILLKAFGESHPNIATGYNNLGLAWYSKEEYGKAIEYYEKALQIDLNAFGETHPDVAIDYNNLGLAWSAKGGYDKAIDYLEKCQAIFDRFFEPTHPNQKTVSKNLASATNSRGMELFSEKKYQEARGYFEKALKNAQKAEDDAFSLTCLNNIGSMQKHLKKYAEGLQSLDMGLQKAAQLNQEIDQAIKEQLTTEMLDNPEMQAKIAELKNLPLILRMQYHKVGCFKGLNRNKEADALAKELWQEGIEAKDTRLLEDLKKEGYDFGGN